MSIRGDTPIRARVTSQGQITVPKRVRDVMRLRPGDEVEFELGTAVVVRRHRPRGVLSFAGIAAEASRRIPPTARELDELISEAARSRAARAG